MRRTSVSMTITSYIHNFDCHNWASWFRLRIKQPCIWKVWW